MRKHMRSVLTAIVLIFVMVLSGCITIVVPTDAPETGVPTETTKVEPTVKPTESVAPTEKTDAPETQAPATSEPATETVFSAEGVKPLGRALAMWMALI